MYGWVYKGKSGNRKLIPGKFQATFIAAVSAKKIHEALSTTKTINSQVFKYFFVNLFNQWIKTMQLFVIIQKCMCQN